MNKTRQILGANISSLMNSSAEFASAPAVERATASKGLKVGRSTVQRVRDGETTVNLDYIEVFAKVFQKEPWHLLHPTLGLALADTAGGPTLAQALEVVVAAISALPQPSRRALSEDLALLAVAPGDPETRHRVATALQAGPSITEKLLSIPSVVESPRLPQRVTEK